MLFDFTLEELTRALSLISNHKNQDSRFHSAVIVVLTQCVLKCIANYVNNTLNWMSKGWGGIFFPSLSRNH